MEHGKFIKALEDYMMTEGITQRELSRRLGWSPADLNTTLKGQKPIGIKRAIHISRTLGIPFEIGAEPSEKESPHPTAKEDAADWDVLVHKSLAPPKGKPEELLFINVFPLELAADPKNETHRRLVQSLTLPGEFSERAPVGLKVRDNSMAPTIKDGAVVGLAFRDRKIIEGELYVLRVAGRGALVRRVFFGLKGYILKADNSAFPELETSITEASIIGKVGWVLQK